MSSDLTNIRRPRLLERLIAAAYQPLTAGLERGAAQGRPARPEGSARRPRSGGERTDLDPTGPAQQCRAWTALGPRKVPGVRVP